MQNFNWFNFFLLLPLSEKMSIFYSILLNSLSSHSPSWMLTGKLKQFSQTASLEFFIERVGYSEKEGKNDRIINNNKV